MLENTAILVSVGFPTLNGFLFSAHGHSRKDVGQIPAPRIKFPSANTDMRFVKKFTPPDFRDKNFTPLISPNFNSFGDKTQINL